MSHVQIDAKSELKYAPLAICRFDGKAHSTGVEWNLLNETLSEKVLLLVSTVVL